MADEQGMTPYEMGEALYYLKKYGELPRSQPRRVTETKRATRRNTDGSVEIYEHEITEEY